jgi:TPR repeat protein
MHQEGNAVARRKWEEGCALADAGETAKAMRAYRASAKLGFSPAQNNLGVLLSYAKPPRLVESVYWYKRAVRSGECAAASNLAVHYRDINKPRWQMHWLRRAAKMGDTDAPALIRKLERQLERNAARR